MGPKREENLEAVQYVLKLFEDRTMTEIPDSMQLVEMLKK